jgi:hypothetical protein
MEWCYMWLPILFVIAAIMGHEVGQNSGKKPKS